jgi:lipopolysaccharide transport system permease protein
VWVKLGERKALQGESGTREFRAMQLACHVNPHHVRIQRTGGWSFGSLPELWRYRDLVLVLAGRDVKLRYRQTVLGVAWVILQPLLAAIIFAVIFGRLAQIPSDGVPYLLFAYTSLVGWNFFSGAVSRAGNSLVGQSHLITKVYFPRLLIPLSSSLAVLVDLAVALVVLAVMMSVYGTTLRPAILTLPLFLLLILLAAWGVSFWLSALSVYYRDFVFALPFLMQVWMYMTPVVFPVSLFPEKWRWLFALNPVAAGVEGVRWAALGRGSLTWEMPVLASLVTLIIFLGGWVFFRRVERTFSDVV